MFDQEWANFQQVDENGLKGKIPDWSELGSTSEVKSLYRNRLTEG